MFNGILKKIFGSRNDRLLKQYSRQVTAINQLEASMTQLSDEQLKGKTDQFRATIKTYLSPFESPTTDTGPEALQAHDALLEKKRGEILNQILPEAFAVVREASKRVLNMRHFDVQLLGGITLHNGKIAEMRTGEGKTLVATLPAYLNALPQLGVHIVTVNDYLAKRDAEWMSAVYRFLGLSVGINLSQMTHEEKKLAYEADITYGTNNEFGFDYLRDNMVYQNSEKVQRPLSYAIVDEVDSILIDEARTPLIISGQAEDTTDLYLKMNHVVPKLVRQKEEKAEGDYWVDEKSQQVMISEDGHQHAEELLTQAGMLSENSSLYDAANINLMHHLNAALRAYSLYHNEQQYVIQNGEVIIVDEFTGRLMPGRRWSEGLHQAVEAKEGVEIQKENQTLATITFQNYFRMYRKMGGMTGTADTEAYEFQQIYGLETVIVPTHHPMIRKDMNDLVYQSTEEKYKAVIADIDDCYKRGQPVLVGTTSIENSELLGQLLQKAGVPHNVLNAKQHAREAEIVAQAGRPKAVTIATNMAGRGTDIVLGGNLKIQLDQIRDQTDLDTASIEKQIEETRHEWQKLHNQVILAGGLHIIGTERHESRRIDNQLRGRSGRQGDPGSSRFYLSLDDQLMRIFAGERVKSIMQRLKVPEGEPIEAGIINRSIENAQRKVEARNFDIRKHLLEYDDVANDQRKVIYQQRNDLLDAEDMSETVTAMREDVLKGYINEYIIPGSLEEQWNIQGLEQILESDLNLNLPIQQWLKDESGLETQELINRIIAASHSAYQDKVSQFEPSAIRQYEGALMLQSIDTHWREHLSMLDHLRQGIHLRSYAQKNPTQEYKRESFELFAMLLETIKTEVTKTLMTVKARSEENLQVEQNPIELENLVFQHELFNDSQAPEAQPGELAEGQSVADKSKPFIRTGEKIGRNDNCPCGSGKKYKQCHGKLV
jgi:preprotein translocase subunit SecA